MRLLTETELFDIEANVLTWKLGSEAVKLVKL